MPCVSGRPAHARQGWPGRRQGLEPRAGLSAKRPCLPPLATVSSPVLGSSALPSLVPEPPGRPVADMQCALPLGVPCLGGRPATFQTMLAGPASWRPFSAVPTHPPVAQYSLTRAGAPPAAPLLQGVLVRRVQRRQDVRANCKHLLHVQGEPAAWFLGTALQAQAARRPRSILVLAG